MIPRTVLMAQGVASQFTALQLTDYGNIILNGYLSTVPNSTNKKAWQYKETTTAPVNLPSLPNIRPALKGWTTNYMQYYTQLPPNAYSQAPGNPTMFEYTVHSFTGFQGPITGLLGSVVNGSGYTTGVYTAVATTTSGSGVGATVNVTVNTSGEVISITLNAAGSGYSVGDAIYPTLPGAGASTLVTSIDLKAVTAGGASKWAQAPRRFFQNQVSAVTPPQNINNPQVIQYSFLHPVADSASAPPIGDL
jgi:hypothetical protein